MKLITFTQNGVQRIGALEGTKVIDLHTAFVAKLRSEGKLRASQIADAYIPATDMNGFLQGGEESMEFAKQAIEFALNNESAISQMRWKRND